MVGGYLTEDGGVAVCHAASSMQHLQARKEFHHPHPHPHPYGQTSIHMVIPILHLESHVVQASGTPPSHIRGRAGLTVENPVFLPGGAFA